MFQRFLKDESGATAIEYGLIAALMTIVIVSSFTLLGSAVGTVFQYLIDNVVVVLE